MMEDPHVPGESPGESLASVPPTPVKNIPAREAGSMTLGSAVLTVAGAGVAFVMATATLTPVMGATRSAKLQWEERMALIEQAEHEAQAKPCANDQSHAQPQDGQHN